MTTKIDIMKFVVDLPVLPLERLYALHDFAVMCGSRELQELVDFEIMRRMPLLERLTIVKKTCQHLARYRNTEGMTSLCQAVNRLWQDSLNNNRVRPTSEVRRERIDKYGTPEDI